jgi:hypothetical protein
LEKTPKFRYYPDWDLCYVCDLCYFLWTPTSTTVGSCKVFSVDIVPTRKRWFKCRNTGLRYFVGERKICERSSKHLPPPRLLRGWPLLLSGLTIHYTWTTTWRACPRVWFVRSRWELSTRSRAKLNPELSWPAGRCFMLPSFTRNWLV